MLLLKLENNELVYIPNEEFRVFLQADDDNRYALILSTSYADYVIIDALGEGAGGEFSEIVRELYTRKFFERVEDAMFGDIKTIDVISVYEDVIIYLESLINKKEEPYEDNIIR